MYYRNPTNVKASAKRYFEEARAAGGKGKTAGQLAQATQQSAFPERYDQQKQAAGDLLKTFNKARRKGTTPRAAQRKGKYAGSQKVVRELLGSKVRGDKEPGHSAGGMHDPANPAGYAQDIGSAGPNRAEREPRSGYSQQTVSRIARKLRARGAKIPKDFKLGQNWTGTVQGYDIELLTATHGTGPHIHIGAEWTGGGTSSGGVSAPPSSFAGTGGVSGGTTAPGRARDGQKARRRAPGRSRRRQSLADRRRRQLLEEIIGTRLYDEPTVPISR